MSDIRLIDAEALKKAIEKYRNLNCVSTSTIIGVRNVMYLIDNAPTVAVNCKDCDGYEAGYSAGLKDAERPQGEYVDISKLRLMTVEECAGHTIEYAMGWKACIEWLKKGGAE